VGRSDPFISNFYKTNIAPIGDVALLGFTNNNFFHGDLYDLKLNNWDINSEWKLDKKYDTIICTRCAYFAKDPEGLIKRCYDNLNDGGRLYVDWGLGDHWRFENYKIGWIKDGEQEHAYKEDNFLWSAIWDDSFFEDYQFELFSRRVKKFGYDDVKKAIFDEVPKVMDLSYIKEYFTASHTMMSLWDDGPQLYILVGGIKK
tara:strand:- start:554 stop:1156 length:603 start_codon:yes stop_codon:yes gene_type:complete